MFNVKNKINGNFTIVLNSVINDTSISRDARFLYIYLASKPNDWNFINSDISKNLNCGAKSLQKYFNELVVSGWIKKTQNREGGKFGLNVIILNSEKESNFLPNGKNKPTVTESKKTPYGKNSRTVKTNQHTNTNKDNNTNTIINTNKESDFSNSNEFVLEPLIIEKKGKKEPKEKPLYTLAHVECRNIYQEWYKKNYGVKPSIDIADRTALKKIIIYFISTIEEKENLSLFNDEEKIEKIKNCFLYIFENWNILKSYYRNKTSLKDIYSNINHIVSQFKNEKPNQQNTNSFREKYRF